MEFGQEKVKRAHVLMVVPVASDINLQPTFDTLEAFFTQNNQRVATLPGVNLNAVEHFLTTAHRDQLLEDLVAQYDNEARHNDIVFLPGVPLCKHYALGLNFAIAATFRAIVLFVLSTEAQDFVSNVCSLQIASEHYRRRFPHVTQCLMLDNCHVQLAELTPQYQTLLANKWPLIFKLQDKASLTALQKMFTTLLPPRVTPPFFRHYLLKKACSAQKTIVLPEGNEPRTIMAANICAERDIAHCVLLAPREKITATCAALKLELHPAVTIIEPQAVNIEKYAAALYEVRREKGLTLDESRQQLQESTMLGIMMLHAGEVDGLVSGAVHTTAETIRPALQVMKLAPHVKRASSIFFMCLPEQVLVYGDCAVNADPSAEELADIAIQSASSAVAFGIEPKVAMLSYSTGSSGSGPSVDKIRQATELVKTLRPDLAIEGPIQFDAAISEQVARIKCAKSKIAGQATVFIVPNLDVGNILYKAVQWGAGVMCIGPMLQGLNKPVNDLSRGCKVEDIVFTIAVTVVQAALK